MKTTKIEDVKIKRKPPSTDYNNSVLCTKIKQGAKDKEGTIEKVDLAKKFNEYNQLIANAGEPGAGIEEVIYTGCFFDEQSMINYYYKNFNEKYKSFDAWLMSEHGVALGYQLKYFTELEEIKNNKNKMMAIPIIGFLFKKIFNIYYDHKVRKIYNLYLGPGSKKIKNDKGNN